jgi:hypothetical protein
MPAAERAMLLSMERPTEEGGAAEGAAELRTGHAPRARVRVPDAGGRRERRDRRLHVAAQRLLDTG